MPYPDAHSHHQTEPVTALDPPSNPKEGFIGNAWTTRQTAHQTGGTPHPPYSNIPLLENQFRFNGDGLLVIAAAAIDETQNYRFTYSARFDLDNAATMTLHSAAGVNYWTRVRWSGGDIRVSVGETTAQARNFIITPVVDAAFIDFEIIWNAATQECTINSGWGNQMQPFATAVAGVTGDIRFGADMVGVIRDMRYYIGSPGNWVLKNYWPLDEGAGTVIKDYGPAAQDGVLTVGTGSWEART